MLHENLIGGRWCGSSGSKKNINPSDVRDVIGEYARANETDVRSAIQAAKSAFHSYSRSTPQHRYDILKKISDELLLRKDELWAALVA